jgi:repressor of nif and glnA expression
MLEAYKLRIATGIALSESGAVVATVKPESSYLGLAITAAGVGIVLIDGITHLIASKNKKS